MNLPRTCLHGGPQVYSPDPGTSGITHITRPVLHKRTQSHLRPHLQQIRPSSLGRTQRRQNPRFATETCTRARISKFCCKLIPIITLIMQLDLIAMEQLLSTKIASKQPEASTCVRTRRLPLFMCLGTFRECMHENTKWLQSVCTCENQLLAENVLVCRGPCLPPSVRMCL